MTGRETGANTRPATIKTASSRRMAKFSFTTPISHKLTAMESSPPSNFYPRGIDRYQAGGERFSPSYLSDRPMTAISSAIFSR